MISAIFKPRYQLPAVLAGWGLWIAVHLSFDATPTLAAMQYYATEYVWGAVFMATGAASIAVMAATENQHGCIRCQAARLLSAASVATGWFFIFLLLAFANPRSTATLIYFALVVESVLNFVEQTQLVQIKQWRRNNGQSRYLV